VLAVPTIVGEIKRHSRHTWATKVPWPPRTLDPDHRHDGDAEQPAPPAPTVSELADAPGSVTTSCSKPSMLAPPTGPAP
jgi:hypothetical protein